MRVTRVLAAAVVIGLAGCHHDSTGPAGPLNGSWEGSVTGEFTMDATLSDRNGSVTGSGVLSGPAIVNPPIDFTVSGTDNGGSFNMILTAQGRSGNPTYSGSVVSADTLSGTFGGGLTGSMVMVKN